MSGVEPFTPSTLSSPRALQAAIDLYTLWRGKPAEDHTPLDRIVSTFFRAHRELNAGERRWISSAIYGTVRNLRRQASLLSYLKREQSPGEIIALWRDQTQPGATPEIEAAAASLPGIDSPEEHVPAPLSLFPMRWPPHLRICLARMRLKPLRR